MDPQILLIGVAVFVLSALLIYLISVFGIKEKSFEEALAEQRCRIEAENQKVRDEKKAEKERKKGKKSKEKIKEKVSQPKETKMVNLEIDAEIIEPLEAKNESKKPTPRSRKGKSILHNKDEEPKVAKETVNVIHSIPPPKDELELLHQREKPKEVEVKVAKVEKSKQETKPSKKIVVEEQMVAKTDVKLQKSSPYHDKKDKQSKFFYVANFINFKGLESF